MKLRHQLLLVTKYQRPKKARGLFIPDSFKVDHSRSLWEVVKTSEEANEMAGLELEEGMILVTPPRSGIFAWYDYAFNDVGVREQREIYWLLADSIARVIPWTKKGGEVVLGNRILIKPDKPVDRVGMIEVPNAFQVRPVTGRIEEIGPDVRIEGLEVGARVLHTSFAGMDVELDGERFLLMEETQPMMILDEDVEVGT